MNKLKCCNETPGVGPILLYRSRLIVADRQGDKHLSLLQRQTITYIVYRQAGLLTMQKHDTY